MIMEDLKEHIDCCEKCKLHERRINTVLGDGNPQAKIMFIGEGPGEQEDLSGNAFVGKAGKLLDKMMECIGLNRKNSYICNVVKCRPPNNRNPESEEITACMDYLRYQFQIIRPEIIVLLGSIACKAIIDENFSIMKRHGEIIDRKGIVFIPTFHPSALLRDESKKPLAYNDLKKIREIIEKKNIKI